MPDWLVWVVAIASIIAAIAQVIGTWLQWFMLRELGDLDQDRDDWFESPAFRTYTDVERAQFRAREAERQETYGCGLAGGLTIEEATEYPEKEEQDDSHETPPFP